MAIRGIYNEAGEPLGIEHVYDDDAPDVDDYYERDYDEPEEMTREECIAKGVHGDDASGHGSTWTCDRCNTDCTPEHFAHFEGCPACGEYIDYCQGHGEIGDPAGRAILDAHDADDHSGCHPQGCLVAATNSDKKD